MNFSIKKSVLVVGVILLGLIAIGCNSKNAAKDKAAATVNNKVIPKEKLDSRLKAISASQPKLFEGKDGKKRKKELRKQILNSMIMEELLIDEAKRQGVKIDNAEIEKRSKAVMKQIPEQLRKQQNITQEQIEENMRRQMAFSFLQQKLSKGIKVSKAEVEAYYRANKQQFPKQTLAQARETITRVLQGQKVGEKLQALGMKLKKSAKITETE